MKPRTTLFLVVAALAALFVGWQFGLRTEPATQQTEAAGRLVFPDLAAALANAARVEITHAGKTLVIVRNGDKWGLADRAGFPVQADKLRELFSGLTELRITEPRTADAAEWARLGVEDPQAAASNSNLLRVLDAGGKPIAELIVGHRRVRTQGNLPESIYIRRPGEQQSWLAEGRLPVDADPALWFERDIANIAPAKIAHVTVTRGDSVLEFARDGDKFSLVSPADHPKLDNYRVEDVARGLETLTLTDVKPSSDPPAGAEKLGTSVLTTTDGMVVTVTVFKAGPDIWTQYAATGTGDGKTAAEALQARVGGWIYEVGSWKEKSFVPTLDDLKADEPAPAQPGAPTPGAPMPAAPSQ